MVVVPELMVAIAASCATKSKRLRNWQWPTALSRKADRPLTPSRKVPYCYGVTSLMAFYMAFYNYYRSLFDNQFSSGTMAQKFVLSLPVRLS